jgi:glycosyltransferase involved in cell wall biosynthesis
MSNINILIKNKILLLFHNLSIKRADLTIFPSKFFYKTIKIKPKKFRIINHGVEEVFFQKRNSFKIYNHTDLNKPFKIMYLSKYESYKNHINLVCAVNILKKKRYNISLSLIGVDKKQIKGTKLLNKIDSINNRYPNLIKLTKIQKHKNLNLLFNKFDLHVYPSICESFGIIILETIASSLPIICSDFRVFKEILKKNTLYFDPLNQNDIANKILYYIKNYKLRKKNTYKLRKIAKKFNWKKSCNLTFNTLLETAKNK